MSRKSAQRGRAPDDVDVSGLLSGLACDLWEPERLERIASLTDGATVNWPAFVAFDREVGGPSVEKVTRGREGQYDVTDRDVFRPLQYCRMNLGPGVSDDTREWVARQTVHMAGLHLECLLKRIAVVLRLPLGACLRHPLVRARVGSTLREQIGRFAKVYNMAKHDVSQDKDTHRFCTADAVLAYFVARRLALALYPIAGLASRGMWEDGEA